MKRRYLGIDIGAETIKLAELHHDGGGLRWTGRALVEHHKEPAQALLDLLAGWRWDEAEGAAISGRFARQFSQQRVPEKLARTEGFRFLHPGSGPSTLVSIGSHGFSVLELHSDGPATFRANSRCSQGTGNFLRQLVERFDLEVGEASALCADVEDPAPLSGRCPVILKTDMTHLANHGQDRARILAGLFDAVAENVQVLIKPRLSPPRVSLLGGVSRSRRIRDHFAGFLARSGMELVTLSEDEALFTDAVGCAVLATHQSCPPRPLEDLVEAQVDTELEQIPSLSDSLVQVRRMEPPTSSGKTPEQVVLGLDIGSTGSKAVALDPASGDLVWQGYVPTSGDSVGAAQRLVQQLVDGPAGELPVRLVGATGSGREIVGSLLVTCYGPGSVFILNEIAAHAQGALHYDPRVDTVFEIGGQDAKYIRLASGRVVDAAMNEACSAGTGSFIEEQGRRFSGIRDVVHLGEEALRAGAGVSLGQHCSVFMAEIIDEAVAQGIDQGAIIAGIYDSIVQNYLNRVKGSRSVGDVVFCQGMPFSSDALAAAVARQTGSEVVVPPDPGTIGALGIALLTAKERSLDVEPLDPRRFLDAEVLRRDDFVCRSTKGCGGAGNKCRIDRISTVVQGERKRFTWGGGCSLYDRGTGSTKLPDGAPDPFREREELVAALIRALPPHPGRPRIALSDEFVLKGMFPFFATFLSELGFGLDIHRGADQALLKRGIEDANVPFCAPMQQMHGLASVMAESRPDHLFLPMLRSLPRVGTEERSVLCPIVQASPDLLRLDLGTEVLSPVFDVDEGGLGGPTFRSGCEALALSLGAVNGSWIPAFERALGAQRAFERQCLELGRRALRFSVERGVVPVVVLGRPYTIYNKVLNSNVPTILREQGAMAIPVDCYPVDDDTVVFQDLFWAYGQRNLRAAHQIRRTPGLYSVWCSNYSCGPDSFNLHFYAFTMQGRPYAIIETDGHSGDAGTKTRIEAFLYCVREDLDGPGESADHQLPSMRVVELDKETMADARRRGELVLIPRMGPGAGAVAACLRGLGVQAESLPLPDAEALRLGRRYTSGKECVPMTITLGSLLQRLQGEEWTDQLFCLFMPTAKGPCRFGVYNLLHKIVLERLGWKDRVRVWSPEDKAYFDGLPRGFAVLVFAAFMASDLLLEAMYDVRPAERSPGAAERLHHQYRAELYQLVEQAAARRPSLSEGLLEVATGRLFGVTHLLRRAARALAEVKRPGRLPTVLVVGEIYVRCDPFSNDFIIDRLEERGIRVRFAPINEWIEYTSHLALIRNPDVGWSDRLEVRVRSTIQAQTYRVVADALDWPERTSVKATLAASAPYLREALEGEAVLTVGGPVHEWREGIIDAVVNVGPLECMPSKIAEAQFFHVAEREGLLSLTVPVNGDPVDPEVIDGFAYEVKARFRERRQAEPAPARPQRVVDVLRGARAGK